MPKTYNDLYLATRTALKSAGVEAYALEARLLVAYAVGKTKEEFVRDLRLYTSDENEQKIQALLQRRIAGEPLAYLIGLGGYAVGLVLSTLFDLPSGALIVWCLALLAIVVHAFGPARDRAVLA